MAAPTATATLNKTTFVVGEEMRLTVTRADADNKGGTVTVVVTDSQGNESSPVVGNYSITDPVSVEVTDPDRVWALVSDDGTTAVYTSVA